MSKILANEIANFGDNAPIDLKEGLNIPAGKPIQAAGSAGSSGQVLSSTGTSIAWVAPFDGDYNSLSNRPTIPPAQVQSDWNATSGLGVVLNKPAVPPLPSVTTAAAGSAALTYNSGNGEFTFTPPDLSSYLTAETDTLDTVLGRGATTTRDITTTGKVYFSNNFADLTALSAVSPTTYHGMFAHVHAEGHGYFAHAGAWIQLLDTGSSIGELADVDLSVAPTTGQVLKYDGSNWIAGAASSGGGLALTDFSVSTNAASGGGALTYNNLSGVFSYTPPDLSGYLTSLGDAAGVTTQKINNWDAAFGWGDHSTAGYLTSYTETDTLDTVTGRGYTTTNTIQVGRIEVGSSNLSIDDVNSDLELRSNTGTVKLLNSSGQNSVTAGGDVYLYSTGTTRLNTTSAGVTITGALTAGGLTYPTTNGTNGQVLTSDGAGNVTWQDSTGGGGNTSVTISDTAPGSASAGDLWWESDTGRLKIYYQDTDTIQWVDTNPALRQDRIASTGAPATASSTGTPGDIRYDSSYVYICIANNTWKRAALATW
jgi:hypothetical protein